jgi:hypothetical protein
MATLLLLLVAAGVAVAAFFYVGGMDYVSTLWPASGPAKPAGTPAVSATPTATAVSGTQDEFARRMYVEQLESRAVLQRMADGEIDSLAIKRVLMGETTATVEILAAFKDGTRADGAISLLKSGDAWYLFSLTGLRKGETPGMSTAVESAEAIEASHGVEAAAAELGVKTFDQGVIDTLLAEQSKHQTQVNTILDGTYNAINLTTANQGVGTVTIPVTMTGPNSKTATGEIVLIRKDIDGQTRTFLTTLGQ